MVVVTGRIHEKRVYSLRSDAKRAIKAAHRAGGYCPKCRSGQKPHIYACDGCAGYHWVHSW